MYANLIVEKSRNPHFLRVDLLLQVLIYLVYFGDLYGYI